MGMKITSIVMMSQPVVVYSERFLILRRKSWIEHWLIGIVRRRIEGMISSLKDKAAEREGSVAGSSGEPVIRSATPANDTKRLMMSNLCRAILYRM